MAQADHRFIRRDPWSNEATAEPAVADANALSAADAARFLHVSHATLESWEQKFGFPARLTLDGAIPLYPVAQLLALRASLDVSASVGSAVRDAQRRLTISP